MNYRVGLGYDIHRLKSGRPLFLAGVRIPFKQGLLGHSDADVLLHAVCDALLGAAGLGDIGDHFPDSDIRYKNTASSYFAKKIFEILKRDGFKICYIDTVIIMERPKLASFKEAIRKSLANIFSLQPNQVSVKAKTNEGLGPVGQSKAIAAYAVVLLKMGGNR